MNTLKQARLSVEYNSDPETQKPTAYLWGTILDNLGNSYGVHINITHDLLSISSEGDGDWVYQMPLSYDEDMDIRKVVKDVEERILHFVDLPILKGSMESQGFEAISANYIRRQRRTANMRSR